MEEQLSVISTRRCDQFQDCHYDADSSQLEEGRETEGSSMRESMYLSQNKLTWKCLKCGRSNSLHMNVCQGCVERRPGWNCFSCGAYNEHPNFPCVNPGLRHKQAQAEPGLQVQGTAIPGAQKQAKTFPRLTSASVAKVDDSKRSNAQL